MSVTINPALVAARAYVRPTQIPVKAGFAIDQEPSSARRQTVSANRRTAPAIEISLSPEALDLLAKGRSKALGRADQTATKDEADQASAKSRFEEILAARNHHADRAYTAPPPGSDRSYLRPGSQLDITL